MSKTESGKHKQQAKTGKKPINKKQSIWAPGMPFEKMNYILMVAGIIVLLIGYFLLSGGGTDDPAGYSEAIFDTRRLYIAPIVLVFGFLVELFAIMYRPKIKNKETESTDKQ